MAVYLVMLCLAALSCNPEDPNDGCRQLAPNPKLKQVFYWGDFSFPNRGSEVGGIANPVWAAPGRIYVSTGYWRDDYPVEGIFAIEFAPWGTSYSFEYRNFSVLELPHDFWTLIHGSEQDGILFVGQDASGSWVGDVNFTDPSSETELVGREWQPWGIAKCPNRPGIVFYGNPSNGVEGFYWRVPEAQGSPADSLLYAVSLSKLSQAHS